MLEQEWSPGPDSTSTSASSAIHSRLLVNALPLESGRADSLRPVETRVPTGSPADPRVHSRLGGTDLARWVRDGSRPRRSRSPGGGRACPAEGRDQGRWVDLHSLKENVSKMSDEARLERAASEMKMRAHLAKLRRCQGRRPSTFPCPSNPVCLLPAQETVRSASTAGTVP